MSHRLDNTQLFQAVKIPASAARPLLWRIGMAVTMTPRLLHYVSTEIMRGRPLAALLRAAEYLESNAPVWRALVRAAGKELAKNRYREAEPAIRKLLAGELGSLSEAELRMLKEVREPPPSFRRQNCPGLLRRRTRAVSLRPSGFGKFKLAP